MESIICILGINLVSFICLSFLGTKFTLKLISKNAKDPIVNCKGTRMVKDVED